MISLMIMAKFMVRVRIGSMIMFLNNPINLRLLKVAHRVSNNRTFLARVEGAWIKSMVATLTVLLLFYYFT